MNTSSTKQESSSIRCSARRYNDQMICGKCGLQWGIDDPEPPKCPGKKTVGLRALEQIKKTLDD